MAKAIHPGCNEVWALVFLIGGMWVIDGALQLGTLVAFSAYLSRSTGPVQTFLRLYVVWARAKVSLSRIWELARQPQAVLDPEAPKTLPADGRGSIEIDNVSFSHSDHDGGILKGASLRIPAGKRVAITGASGEGKSTLMDLLQRHFDP